MTATERRMGVQTVIARATRHAAEAQVQVVSVGTVAVVQRAGQSWGAPTVREVLIYNIFIRTKYKVYSQRSSP